MNSFVYKGEKTRAISFPLGGIGSGSIGIAGNGRLIDWEIFNKPNKGSVNGFSHFAIKVESDDCVLDARVLNGDLPPHYIGGETSGVSGNNGFGQGPGRETLAGAPHFRDVEFHGQFPFATVKFLDQDFPGSVNMTAFNPFIPLNDIDSSIPGAFFEIEILNNTDKSLTYTICATVSNPFKTGAFNSYCNENDKHHIKLSTDVLQLDDPQYGDLTIATDAKEISFQEYWYRGSWFDNLGIFWRQFTALGKLSNRVYEYSNDNKSQDVCTLAAHTKIAAGESGKIRFVLTWNYPNAYNYWNPEKCECSKCECESQKPKTWKNYYVSLFKNSTESACYSLKNWERLYNDTMNFKKALFRSSLPEVCIDAVSANISILKTPTCLRLEDGAFYGWEGCNCSSGCCEGSCTHVWNYAYALPFLFPKLERSMRDLDFAYNQSEDGGMAFRLQLPLGRERSKFRPCTDGQFGGVIKAYRDWKISGDTAWLKKNWSAIKKCIEYAWAQSNTDKWDEDKDGVLEGRQHHTLDMELFGPNSWLTGFYLAALKAAAEMASFLGESDTVAKYEALFEKGKKWVDSNLFNGEYYHQKIDIKDNELLSKFITEEDNSAEGYWNDEAKEIKYQIDQGCGVDQVVAQWHANLCGLGEIFDPMQTRKALHSIYKYNFKKSMRKFFNPCRLYSLNDEAGVVICEWPEGTNKPIVPVTYSEETMNGFEYQAAIHMIQEGMVEEGVEIVKAIRERYDGERRNPWNEFECGSNYARSMASYSLLNAFSGFQYNMAVGMIGFNPINKRAIESNEGVEFTCFWSLDSGWGLFIQKEDKVIIELMYGHISIKMLVLPFLYDKSVGKIALVINSLENEQKCDEKKISDFSKTGANIRFDNDITIKKGSGLVVEIV